ncbi:MAG: hypothetical protein M3321_09290 [Actinomycetota bacterium]|nr:hypothetical protein [Actinomycetota bacterium]
MREADVARAYHNVFVSYRGPSIRTAAGAADRQLEDNATKALVNVLELAPDGANLVRRFVDRFVGERPRMAAEPVFHLQPRRRSELPARRFLLGLSASGDLPSSSSRGTTGTSAGRVDAAIVVPGEVVVALEVKVGDSELERGQLERHDRTWGVGGEPSWRARRWRDVYGWAIDERASARDPVTRFLLDQFASFLELAGLTPFLGFEEADFAFFAAAPAKRDPLRRPVIRARLSALCERVLLALPVETHDRLGEPRVHPLRMDDHAAAAHFPGGKREVNMSIEVAGRDLQVDLVGWNDPQAETLVRWLRAPTTTSWLRTHPDLELAVYRRWPRNRYTRDGVEHAIFRGGGSTELSPRIPAARFTVARLDALLAKVGDPAWNRPGLHLRRAWPKRDAVVLGDSVVPEIAAALVELEPLVASINSGSDAQPP